MSGGGWTDAAKKVIPLVIAVAAAAIEHGARNSRCRHGELRRGDKPSRSRAKRSARKTKGKKS